jgi:hypothetical protein
MKKREFAVGLARKVLDAWRWECLLSGLPYMQANLSAGQLYIELRSPWALTNKLWGRLNHALEDQETLYRSGDAFWIYGIAARQTERRAVEILFCIKSCRPDVEEAFDIPPQFLSGWAECVWNQGFENELVEGQNYEVREICNMPGHVMVLRPGDTPLVGIHLERFRFHYPDESDSSPRQSVR